MSLTLTMLGTGHATVTKCYNTCFLLHENEEYFMVDAGGGNQILGILEKKRIEISKIHDLFITHTHSDHILGVVWMVRKIGQCMRQNAYDGELRIYAHPRVIEGLKTLCGVVLMKKVTDLFDDRIRFIELKDKDVHKILNRDVLFLDLKAEKTVQYGFKIEEERFIFCGDEPLRESLYSHAKKMKYMIREAFCLEAECDKFKPHEKKHSTVKDACMLAEDLGIQNLVLVHTEDSYIGMDAGRKELYTEEGKQFFSGNLYVPEDGEEIII